MNLLYLLLTIYILILCFIPEKSILNNKIINDFLLYCLFIYVSIMIVSVDNHSIDMSRHIIRSYSLQGEDLLSSIINLNSEPGFSFLLWFSSNIPGSTQLYIYIFVWIFFFLPLFIGLSINMNSNNRLILTFLYINFFFTANYLKSTVSQGISISFILMLVLTMINNKKRYLLRYTGSILAPFFHFSSLPLSIISLFINKIKYKLLIIIWLISIFIFITGLNELLLGSFSNISSLLEIYTSSSTYESYGTYGIRYDFLLFSVIFGAYGFFFLRTKRGILIMKFYYAFNSYFLLLGFISYSDRLAAFSWFLIPLIVFFTIPNDSKYRNFLIAIFILLNFIIGNLSSSFLL